MELTHCNAFADRDVLADLIRTVRRLAGQPGALPPLPGAHDAAGETAGWILRDPEPVAGAWLERQTESRGRLEIAVLPDRRRAGAGSRLLEEALKTAAEWELAEVLAAVPAGQAAAEDFAAKRGFVPAGLQTVLAAGADAAAPRFKIGGDYFFQQFSRFSHLPTLSALLNRAYADHYGRPENEHGTVTVESLGRDLAAHPEDEFFLFLDMFGKGVAVVRTRAGGWIDAPAVVREERGNGLLLPLLSAALEHLQGERRMIAYDTDAETLASFQRLGFETVEQYTLFKKAL